MRNKQSSLPTISLAVATIAAAALVAFIGELYFVTRHKKEEAEAMQNRQTAGNGLPPRPEEHWCYIKELESRQPGIRTPTEPTAGGEVMKPEQLTDEQRQLLAQVQADMRQQPAQPTEMPRNKQTPAQRQQTLQRQRLAQQQQQARQQQWAQTQPQAMQQWTQAQSRAVQQQPRVRQPKPVQQQQPKQAASNQRSYQNLLQTPAHTNTTQSYTQAAAPVTRVEEAPKAAEKKDSRNWIIQCGPFKDAERAETVRAQLAFEGFASHITTNNGWSRVVIDPLKGKESANEMIARPKMAGHANCVRLAARG